MMKRLAFTAFALLCVGRAASADVLVLPGDEPLRIQFDNVEQIDTTGLNSIDVPGTVDYGTAGNWGVLKVSNISFGVVNVDNTLISGGGSQIFADAAGGQITGLFYDIDLTSGTTATGGILDLYWYEGAFIGAPSSYDPNDATVDLFTSGTFLARLIFSPGIISGDATTTITSTIDVFTALSGEGSANGFLSVDLSTPGLWTDVLNGDWFFVDVDGDGIFGEAGETRDVRFRNTFNLFPGWDGDPGILGLTSTDPATVFTTPEPASLALFGFGLLGLARARRRHVN